MLTDTSLALAGKLGWLDVGLDALGMVPGLGLLRADAKAAEAENALSEIPKRRGWNLTRQARTLRGTLAAYDRLKGFLEKPDFASAIHDLGKGLQGLIDQAFGDTPCQPPTTHPLQMC